MQTHKQLNKQAATKNKPTNKQTSTQTNNQPTNQTSKHTYNINKQTLFGSCLQQRRVRRDARVHAAVLRLRQPRACAREVPDADLRRSLLFVLLCFAFGLLVLARLLSFDFVLLCFVCFCLLACLVLFC